MSFLIIAATTCSSCVGTVKLPVTVCNDIYIVCNDIYIEMHKHLDREAVILHVHPGSSISTKR